MSDKESVLDKLMLGKSTPYASTYDASLLTPIPRRLGREELGIDMDQPGFVGMDLWTAYELSWLNLSGKPQVAIGEFWVPASSPAIVESKSFKLYLNSFNQTAFANWSDVALRLEQDLSNCAGAAVIVKLYNADAFQKVGVKSLPGESIDHIETTFDCYTPDPVLLDLEKNSEPVTESLHSHLLKTNCPVTGQPDWASLFIRYTGRQINREGLLKYIVSFREQQDFHEQCVERIFSEIMARCEPEKLDVYARYTRRGGLDINPWRSSHDVMPLPIRLVRQ